MPLLLFVIINWIWDQGCIFKTRLSSFFLFYFLSLLCQYSWSGITGTQAVVILRAAGLGGWMGIGGGGTKPATSSISCIVCWYLLSLAASSSFFFKAASHSAFNSSHGSALTLIRTIKEAVSRLWTKKIIKYTDNTFFLPCAFSFIAVASPSSSCHRDFILVDWSI